MPPKIGEKVQYQGKDAYVSALTADGKLTLIQDGRTINDVNASSVQSSTSSGDANTEGGNTGASVVKDLAEKTTSNEAAANNAKNNVSDMSAAAPGSQRNTNQPDSDDLDDDHIPAPGTGDTGAGLASDGRGRQKLDTEIKDSHSEATQPIADTAGATTIGKEGLKARAKAAGIPDEIRKKMDKPVFVRRLHGTEEILVQANRATLSIVDRNGRRLEVGSVVSLPVRIIGLNSAQEVEVVYPPYIPAFEEIPTNEGGQLKTKDGQNYTGSTYKISDDNQVVNVNTGQPENEDERPKQTTLTVEAVRLERT